MGGERSKDNKLNGLFKMLGFKENVVDRVIAERMEGGSKRVINIRISHPEMLTRRGRTSK